MESGAIDARSWYSTMERLGLKATRVVPLWVGPACLLSACAGAAGPGIRATPPGLSVHLHEIFYDVTGSTAEELHDSIITRGPKMGDWPLFALTEWEVRWRVRPPLPGMRSRVAAPPGRCAIQGAEVELTTRTVLPRWRPSPQASPTLQAEWDVFLEALKVHETGHRDLGVQAAIAVLRSVRSVRSFWCGSLVAEADSAAQRTLQHYHEQNVRYDRETRYGETQGVVWPPYPSSRWSTRQPVPPAPLGRRRAGQWGPGKGSRRRS